MDTSGDAVCWNSEGRRWRHPSTSNPKITQGVSRCDPSCSRNISDGIQQCLCGHCVSRVKGKLHCDTTELQNPGGLLEVEEGEPEGVAAVSWRQRHPTIMLGSCYPFSSCSQPCWGHVARRETKAAPCEILKPHPQILLKR